MASATDYLGTAGDIGQILAQIAAARAQGRVQQAGVQQNQARAAADVFDTRMRAALTGPATEARQVARGDTMANIQPFAWSGDTKMVGNIPVPQSSGGLTPANFGPATRQAGRDLATVAGSRVTSPVFNLPEPPKLDPLPESGLLDSLLNAGGAGGALAGALGGLPGSGAGGDIGKLISDMVKKLRGNGGADTGPASVPGGSSEFDDWFYNTYGDRTNPEEGAAQNGAGGLETLPGAVDPMDEYLRWLASQQGGGSDNESASFWDE